MGPFSPRMVFCLCRTRRRLSKTFYPGHRCLEHFYR
jgi:hypothetical protein